MQVNNCVTGLDGAVAALFGAAIGLMIVVTAVFGFMVVWTLFGE